MFYVSQKHEFDELELQLSIKNDNQLSSRFMFLITHQHRRSFLLIFRYILKWIFILIMYRLFCDYTSKDCVVKLKKLLNLEKKYFRHHRVLFKDLSVLRFSLCAYHSRELIWSHDSSKNKYSRCQQLKDFEQHKTVLISHL